MDALTPVVTTTGELAAALAKAQGAMEAAAKDSTNPFFHSKYADLASVWGACRKPLADNGLAVTQHPVTSFRGEPEIVIVKTRAGEDRATVRGMMTVSLTTRLLHTSGESVESTVSALLPSSDPQTVGSAITYLRRYGLAAMVGVAPDDDDDGNAGSGRDVPARQLHDDLSPPLSPGHAGATTTRPQPPAQSAAPISDAQRKRFFAISKEHGWKEPDVKALLQRVLHVQSSKQIPTHRYDEIVTMLQAGVDAMTANP